MYDPFSRLWSRYDIYNFLRASAGINLTEHVVSDTTFYFPNHIRYIIYYAFYRVAVPCTFRHMSRSMISRRSQREKIHFRSFVRIMSVYSSHFSGRTSPRYNNIMSSATAANHVPSQITSVAALLFFNF